MRYLMTVISPASLVFDPFTSSGTTVVATREMGHIDYGIDLSLDNVPITGTG